MAERFALDTNVYITALRNPRRLEILGRFLHRAARRVRMSAVVALELRAGARSEMHLAAVERLLEPFVSRGLEITPSFQAYVQAGRVLSSLATHERFHLADAPRSFINDVLLAASCREHETILITENVRDFAAIQRHLRGFRFRDSSRVL